MLVLGFYPAPALDLVREPAVTTVDQVGAGDLPTTTTAVATDEGNDK
jgi:NADH-quinone oxidoreductase subunit M